MVQTPLRAGIASFAHVHAPAYAAALREIPGATLGGIWDEDAERGRSGAEACGTTFYARLDELLANVDAAIVASENTRHRDLVLAAAAAKVHVLCEKPLATTIDDARAMIDACARAGVLLGTAFPVRYSDAVRQLRAAVRAGTLGEALMIRATNQGAFPGGWFGDPLLAGGGAFVDHIVHVADLLRWIWGREFIEVYAEAATRHHDLPVEDAGMLLITLEGDVTASLDPSWSRPVDAWPTWGGLTLEVTGTAGVASVDAFAQNVDVYSNRRVRGEWRYWGDNLDKLMLEDWLRAVRAGGPAPISGADGLRALELVLAAYRSAERHEPVPVTR
ncbi:MAG TPA: Gfo/Idh/MocA family oxidoreductase [Roseiflexaceae bacterium]